MFFENTGRERTKLLAELDLQIDNVTHVGPARVCNQRPVAQSSGPKLHTSLEPSDDLPINQPVGDLLDKFFITR